MTTHYQEIGRLIKEKALCCGRRDEDISIIAVTKTCSIEAIQSAYTEGCRNFGESRVQEALPKIQQLPENCQWHFIGTLQSNKIAKILDVIDLIHSVDTLELAHKISEESLHRNITTRILLQVNTSGEKTKRGLTDFEWEKKLAQINRLPNLSLEGLMTMAPFVDDDSLIRRCFSRLRQCHERWKHQINDPTGFKHLSMGMSNDYLIAIEEGATLLRLGSAIFNR